MCCGGEYYYIWMLLYMNVTIYEILNVRKIGDDFVGDEIQWWMSANWLIEKLLDDWLWTLIEIIDND